jgi:hypothetical protein
VDRVDAAGHCLVSEPPVLPLVLPLVLSADKAMRDLEEIRLAALAAGAFAPAIRCVELQGRHIGLWSSEVAAGPTLAEMVGASFAPRAVGPAR